jgi:hypothetical protein
VTSYLEGTVIVPVSELNHVRREAVAALEARRRRTVGEVRLSVPAHGQGVQECGVGFRRVSRRLQHPVRARVLQGHPRAVQPQGHANAA